MQLLIVIHIIIACGCHGIGASGMNCDNTGQCSCRKRVTGKMCDECRNGSWGLSNTGCRLCNCKLPNSASKICNKVSVIVTILGTFHVCCLLGNWPMCL